MKIKDEIVYLLAIVLISFSTAMISAADLGVSMIVAPAYILSLRFDFLTFGQCEYIIQGLFIIVFCFVMRKFKPIYLFSFVTALLYGAMLDMWRAVIPHFRQEVYLGGALPMHLRIIYFVVGAVLTSLAVALFLHSYLYPQVYDFFVKGITNKYNYKLSTFKYIFDGTALLTAVVLSLLFFHGFKGIGIGTLILTVANSFMIMMFNKLIDKTLVITPIFPKLKKYFDDSIA